MAIEPRCASGGVWNPELPTTEKRWIPRWYVGTNAVPVVTQWQRRSN